MARLLSINKIETPPDTGGGASNDDSFDAKKLNNGDCTVHIELPMKNGSKTQGGMKKSPSMGNFCSKRTPVNVQWKNITLTTRKGKQILRQLSGAVYSGELTAIMGPSGAGKSSLLNVLSGFTRQKVTGKILINGANREMRVFRKLTCYILQDDHILQRLTVQEILSVAASLKIPSKVPKPQRLAAIDQCLRSLGLEAQKNQKAGQLSGGQRKRLCIAQELVSNPPLIFLDEPTSGLDSSSCLQCIQLLKSLAEEGRTVVCTIHQPSSKIYEIFDKLYMLAEGQCIYRGSTTHLIPFLAEQGLHCPTYHNPTDYVTEVAMGDYGDWNGKLKEAVDGLGDISENSSHVDLRSVESKQDLNIQSSTFTVVQHKSSEKFTLPQEKIDTPYNGYATSSFNQLRVLFCRSFLCTLREPMNTQLKFVGNVVVGLLLGILYYNIGNDASKVFNNSGLLFCIITFTIFTAKMPTILTFPMERAIFEREHMNSWYSTRMYYLATTAAEIPFQILFPIINCSIVYWMTGQPNDMFRFFLFLVSLVLLSLVSQSIGQLIGAGVSVQNGVYISSVVSIPLLLFCGFLVPMGTIPVYLQWLAYCSYARYTFQSIVLTFYSMDRPFLYCNKTVCPFEDPKEIIKELDMEGELSVDYSALLGFFIFFRLATYLVLKFRVMRMQ